ncbi:cuscuta receptor 1-like [Actinidia eriantha]|uniref:cuscuta receptor 1-like n=1 Tax=Actinidia eriantha TaxID=165200 RepID=UPI00258F6E8D|nr:cuscuta receptor 1-like [Actinidia eriantha]
MGGPNASQCSFFFYIIIIIKNSDLSVLYMCKLECQIWNMQRKNRCVFLLKEMRTILWFWVMLVLASECYGCLEQERTALLQFKDSINHPRGDSLLTWEEALVGEASTDCCQWERVKCNNVTERVIQLSLSELRDWDSGDWYLNASKFLPFKELESLDLSYNSLVGWLPNEGFEKLTSLNKLEILNLSGSHFNNSILLNLGGLTSLKTLRLSDNQLYGKVHIDQFRNLTNLQELDMGYNRIDGFITHSGFERLSSVLAKLEVLTLDDNSLDNSILPFLGGLSSLKTLSLSFNHLNGSINTGGFERLSSVLAKLEVLTLDGNVLDNSILPFLGGLSSLKTLSLRFNFLNGSINTGEFHNMSSLEELDLSYNFINNIKGSDGLKHLKALHLDYSSIDNNFLYNVGVMSSLRVLSLRNSGLNGSLPEQGWCELSNLQELDLSDNNLKGMIPSCLGNLTSIQLLDISNNQLSGNLALSPLSHLTTLEELYLFKNSFEIPIPFVSFFNHSKLKVLVGESKDFIDQIEFQTMIPRFQLKAFVLMKSWSKKLTMKLPYFLSYQYDLRLVFLSQYNLVGTFPVWLLENNTRLEVLHLQNNFLTGPFMMPSHPNPHVIQIDISYNHFDGQVPTNISLIFPNLEFLNLSSNLFQGQIPPSLGNLHSLRILDLSNNNFSGHVPEHLAIGGSSLLSLALSNNNLYGQISPSLANLTNLEFLYLDNNQFEGKLPNSLSTLPLSLLDVSNNHISGQLPKWMGNMSNLDAIIMVSNHFEGHIPVEFCKLQYLQILDLSDNNLSGFVPSCFNSSFLRHVHLNRNNFSGPMTHLFSNCSSLVTMDLGKNKFTGTIPGWIGNFSELGILILKFNHFEGEIPSQICQLKKLSILDLSENNFYGLVPPCFSDIPFKPSSLISYLDGGLFGLYDYVVSMYWREKYISEVEDSKTKTGTNQVEFMTKHGYYAYKGLILNYMSGIDLSCNHLTGEIPPGIGNLGKLLALNFSHNNLTGSIPATFSQLKQIESLDLSYNSLNGRIPPQLIELHSLAVFSVAHNNLSGSTPEYKPQFSTFNESSYEGNPLLCGPPLNNSCIQTQPTSTMQQDKDKEGDDGGFMDMESFYVSFIVSYVIVVLVIVAVLIINPHWRRVWFRFIEVCMISCYYFVLDSFRKILNKRSV